MQLGPYSKLKKIKDFFSYRNIILVCLLTLLLIFLNDDILDLTSFTSNSAIEHSTRFTDHCVDYSRVIKYSTHLEVLGQALFKEYIFPFLLSSFILLIAMVGAIVVTIEDITFKNVKQQNLISQGFRTPHNAIFNFKIYKKKF